MCNVLLFFFFIRSLCSFSFTRFMFESHLFFKVFQAEPESLSIACFSVLSENDEVEETEEEENYATNET